MTDAELTAIEAQVAAHGAEDGPGNSICDWGTGDAGHGLIGEVPKRIAEVRRLRALLAAEPARECCGCSCHDNTCGCCDGAA